MLYTEIFPEPLKVSKIILLHQVNDKFLFLPYLLYCVEIWGNAAECYILPIITLQKKIIRFITFSPYLAYTKNLF